MATATWLGTINSDSENVGNWLAGVLPGTGDDVVVADAAVNPLYFMPAAPLTISSIATETGSPPEVLVNLGGADAFGDYANENLTVTGDVSCFVRYISGGTYNTINSFSSDCTVRINPSVFNGAVIFLGCDIPTGAPVFNDTVRFYSTSSIASGTFNALATFDAGITITGGAFLGGTAGTITIAPPGAAVDHIEFTRDADPTPLATDDLDSGDTATYHAQAMDAADAPLGDAADLAVTGTGGGVTIVPGIYTVKLG